MQACRGVVRWVGPGGLALQRGYWLCVACWVHPMLVLQLMPCNPATPENGRPFVNLALACPPDVDLHWFGARTDSARELAVQ
jgi:hypothetical protein